MEEIPYIRVGTTYFKKVRVPLINSDFFDTHIRWNYETIKQDYGSEIFPKIPKYDGFCVIPDHISYRQSIGNYYNKYDPFIHIPVKGDCSNIISFLKHFFGEQIELGLDYFKILYEQPTHILPILCLISEERHTGKSTFLEFVKNIFSGNMTLNTVKDLRSQFNSDWSRKLIIGIEETLADKSEDNELIKTLSTAKTYKQESKGVDRYEIEFFAKFILCSNNVDNLVKVDSEEIRYWVRDIPKIKKFQVDMSTVLKKEIKYFLHFLTIRPFYSENKSRMWFTPEQIQTKALQRIKNHNRDKSELEIIHILTTILEMTDTTEIQFCVHDIQFWLINFHSKDIDASKIRKIIKTWNIIPCPNTLTYNQYTFNSKKELIAKKGKGRYYTVSDKFIRQFDELMN